MIDSIESPFIHEGTSDNFDALVLQNSDKGPVLVNFWSRKVGPCMRQYPVLDKVVHEYGGRFLLVNLDTDAQRSICRDYGVTSVPTLKLFRNRDIKTTLHGYQDETDLKRVLDTHLPRQSDKRLAEAVRLYQAGQINEAMTILAEAAMEDPGNIRLPLTLAKLLVNEGRFADAEQLLSSMPPEQRREKSIANFHVQIEFLQIASSAPTASYLESRLQEKPDDCAAREQLASLYLANDDYPRALEHFMAIVRTDRQYNNDAGRRGLLAIFSILGDDHELVKNYRGLLIENLL